MKFISILLASILSLVTQAQTPETQLWHLGDSKKDHVGISYEKALEFVKDKKKTPVVVAVIDAGVDVKHPDLRDQLWINTDEIAGNNIDDDNNGYVDDVNGWNFIGGKDGSVSFDNLELTREYARLNEKYELKPAMAITNKEEYAYYQELKKKYLNEQEDARKNFEFFKQASLGIDLLEKEYGTDITEEQIKNHKAKSRTELMAQVIILTSVKLNKSYDYPAIKGEIMDALEQFEYLLNYGYNPRFDGRKMVGDNYENAEESGYGNNEIYLNERFSEHGTHVAGIIAANAENNVGAKGICANCKIMTVRTVPEGDERDKDVANSIRYAADNGAKVLNMSFGKSYSYVPEAVKKALQYAASKNVLLVHAAGNDGSNIDVEKNYPNDFGGEFGDFWIEVGASNFKGKPHMFAEFSNYGVNNVDVFAPGSAIYSTIPANKYEAHDGTSMASPVVAGIAGFIWSYYPEFTAAEIKKIILDSSVPIRGRNKIPGDQKRKKTRAKKISQTGAVVNLYEAVKLAEERYGKL